MSGHYERRYLNTVQLQNVNVMQTSIKLQVVYYVWDKGDMEVFEYEKVSDQGPV